LGRTGLRRRQFVVRSATVVAAILAARLGSAETAGAVFDDLPDVGSPPLVGLSGPHTRLLRETIEAVTTSDISSLPGGRDHLEAATERFEARYAQSPPEGRLAIEQLLNHWELFAEEAGWQSRSHSGRREVLREAIRAPEGPGVLLARWVTLGFVPIDSSLELPLIF
jgi:hypothetical protein